MYSVRFGRFLAKKQRQFDKTLQEERLIATTRAEERDQSQARERAAEAKVNRTNIYDYFAVK